MAITRPAQVMRKTVLNSRGHVTLVFSHQLNSKSNGPIFFKTIIRQRNCFLSSGLQGWTRVKLEKVGPTFASFNAIPPKVTRQNYYGGIHVILGLRDEICSIFSSLFYRTLFVCKGIR